VRVTAIVLVAASLRSGITAVGPIVEEIRDGLGLSNAVTGLLTTLPLLAFAVVSPLAVRLAARRGLDRVLAAAMALLTAGVLLRSWGAVAGALAGTALMGSAIAIGNVLLPGVVRREFPGRGGAMTSLYVSVMVLGAGVAAAISAPLARDLGLGWQGALAVWAAPAALALVFWLPRAARPVQAPLPGELRTRGVLPWRSRLAWEVTLFMGLQSLLFYALLAWLPQLLRDRGESAGNAGLTMALLQVASLVATMVIPIVAHRRPSQVSLIVFAGVTSVAALIGLTAGGTSFAWAWALLLGLGSGVFFALALTFFLLRAPDAERTAALSGMAQSVGYGIAALGPPAAGLLHDASGGWTAPLVGMIVVALATTAAGLPAARDRKIPALAPA
jgi:CP family cyanate transporter-like MFS transporter